MQIYLVFLFFSYEKKTKTYEFMTLENNSSIPIHDLISTYSINIESISHINSYDYNEIHRHNYYEILFFENGGGYQLIDFENIPIKPNSCYIVKPGQVHLVRRESNADGFLIQFTNEMILPDVFLTTLSTLKTQISDATIFENDVIHRKQFIQLLNAIQKVQAEKTKYYKEKSVHLLSNILYSLEEVSAKGINDSASKTNKTTFKFIELVNTHLTELSVNDYADKLNISSKKLSTLVKDQFGITPLKYIHNQLILHIKRDLVFNNRSLKEIAFDYNFDSAPNFSLFVKKQTGLSPSALKKQLMKS